MKLINLTAIYVMWLREMKRFIRAKSRIAGMLGMPLFFLAFLAFGFSGANLPGIPENINYIDFLVPGMVGMTLLFTAMFAGISVLWDREFGFLKEIMVAPVSRVSLVLGRIAGGATTSMLQGILILIISIPIGFSLPSFHGFIFALIFMLLISISFIGLGLIFASKMTDIHGFSMVINFVIFPLFFLSGAIFPVSNLPAAVMPLSYLNPLTYGVDGLRGSLIGFSEFPVLMDFTVLFAFCLLMVFLGAYFFEKTGVD